METKKNAKANTEKTRLSFFLTDLIVAVSLMIFAFNKDVKQQFSSIDVNNTYTDTEILPSTKADMPENKPGKQNGVPVNIWLTIPVRFNLV